MNESHHEEHDRRLNIEIFCFSFVFSPWLNVIQEQILDFKDSVDILPFNELLVVNTSFWRLADDLLLISFSCTNFVMLL